MYKPIPGNPDYVISLNSDIRNNDGSEAKLEVQDNKVTICLYGVRSAIDLKWLALIAHFEIYPLDGKLKSLFTVQFVSNNINFFRQISGKVPVFNKPFELEHSGKKYRVIPMFSRYAISCNGEVIEISSRLPVRLITERKRDNVTVDPYPSVYIYSPEIGRYKYAYVHRLVALAWVNNPNNDFVLRPIVNHIDGNKANFNFKNLEWCSFYENNIHAVNTGLRGDNINCMVRDFYTGEVRKFSSLTQAALYMGLIKSQTQLAQHYDRKAKLIRGKYELKLESDTTPWFYENRTEKAKIGRYLFAVTYTDGTIEYFHDTRDFKKKFNLWNCPKMSDLIYLAKVQNPGVKFEITDFYHADDIQAYDPKTNSISETKTISEMSKRTGVPEHAIRRSLRGEENQLRGGYAFRYKKESSWDTNFINMDLGQNIRFEAVNLTTGEKKVFDAIRQAARFFRVDRTWLKNCNNKGHPLGGWKLTKLDKSV